MISSTDFKPGLVVKWKNDFYQIISCQHVKMQQRAPISKAKMMRLKTGSTVEQSFRSTDKFEEVYLERKDLQYTYKDDADFHFMDQKDYHDISIKEHVMGEKAKYLKDDATVTGLYCDGELLTVEFPASVTLEITETEPGLKGDTAKGGSKPATTETGAVIKVPLFIGTGDKVKVDTRSGEYLSRA